MGEALFYAFFVGIGFGIYYDILRLFRLTVGLDLFFDLLFWVSCSFVTFSYLLIFNSGEIRWIYLVTILVGFLVYILSFGKLFLPIQKTIAKKVKIRLKKFKKVLQLPYLLYYNIKVKFKKPNHKKYEGDEFGKSEQES